MHHEMLQKNPGRSALEEAMELRYRSAMLSQKKSSAQVYTLPVVVHIIHDNGPENISDARVSQGITYINDAYRNLNYYTPATGVDVEIQFCLAQRDLDGNAFSVIRRNQSPATDMSVPSGITLTSIINWDTKDYINNTLVREVCYGVNCGTAGFAVYGPTQGDPVDGITMEAKYFGSSPENNVVIALEMGHYLGLRHTFQSGCKNDDCLVDGDAICDTPPDNSTGFLPCTGAYNTCTTDADDPFANNPFRSPALSGLGDQPDMSRNYMDYSPYSCYDRFTNG